MDPVSIAAGAADLAATCATMVKTLYGWIDDTADVDENVSGLCQEVTTLSRVLESISNASVQVPHVIIAEIDPTMTFGLASGRLWMIPASLVGVSEKPTKQIRFSLRSKDITMINVCLLIHGNSSQGSVFRLLSGLKSQVKRVEFALQTRDFSGSGPSRVNEEDDRVSQNLRRFVQVAENFHSSASTIIGARSTVFRGSILGEPLTEAQTTRIERWIPSPISEQDSTSQSSMPGSLSCGDTVEDDAEASSSSDSDIDKDLARRLEELAIENMRKGDHVKAEQLYRSATDRGEASRRSSREITKMKIQLAYAFMRQDNWIEAEELVSPIAFERRANDILVYHGMHALAMVHLRDSKLEVADRCRNRAL
ncbi:hypothetical protein ACJZ2D_014181 [Fusarium nematophilum]